jgi:hypothetical protein
MVERVRHLAGCGWFWVWALVGAGTAFGLLVLGMLAIPVIALVLWPLVSRPAIRRSAYGLVTGFGLPLLYVAWLQRAGPGTTCWHTATGGGCDQHLNPLPWLIVGIALVTAGLVAHARHG